MLKIFKLINNFILILPILFQLTTSKPFINSYNNITKINQELNNNNNNNNHLNNDDEQMVILFNKTLDYLIPRRRLLDNHNSHNYSKLKDTQLNNISINTNENYLSTSTWTSDLTNVTANTEYFSNLPMIYEDSTHVRRKRNALDDENHSKFDDEHETDEKLNDKRSSSLSSSSSDNDVESVDQNSNVDKSENDELEDYNEESNENETDDQENVIQSKDTKVKRESSDYDYNDDQDKSSSNDVRVKRDETKQTNDKTMVKLDNENNKNTELISSNKNDDDKSKESEEKKDDMTDEKKLTKEDDENDDYEKRVEEKIKRKIDSIKEEIKREIERKRRDRQIEKNNAKFDEIQNKDEEEEEEEAEEKDEKEEEQKNINEDISSNVEDKKVIAKRSSEIVNRPKRRRESRIRSRRRGRRRRRRRISNDNDQIINRLEEIEGVDNLNDDEYRIAESIHESNIKKRFAPVVVERSINDDESMNNQMTMNKVPIKKREKVRQMFIVKNDNDMTRRRKRKKKKKKKKKKRKIDNQDEKRDDDDDDDDDLTMFDRNLLRQNRQNEDKIIDDVNKKVRMKRANDRLINFEYRPQNIEDEENDEGNEFGDDNIEDRTSNLKDRNSNSLIEDQEDKENQRANFLFPGNSFQSQSDLRALASSASSSALSARDSNRRLITDYNEAFGGLQSLRDNPNGALTRFKRIKRVLQNSRTLHKNKLSN